MEKTYNTESLDTTMRSLTVLKVIREHGGLTLSEVAAELETTKSTAHKHLLTLKRTGYLVKEGKEYYISLKPLHFSEYARTRKDAYVDASKKVKELATQTGGEVDFIAENDGKGITVYEAYDRDNPYYGSSSDAADNHWRAGTYYYLHTIATGKAILSTFSEKRVDAIIGKWGLPASTEQTITRSEELHNELDQIREQGYAISNEEYTEGLSAIAQPAIAADGTTLGAFGVSIPTYRMRDSTFKDELCGKLQVAVEEFESEIHRNES